jgi:hypothetical protein
MPLNPSTRKTTEMRRGVRNLPAMRVADSAVARFGGQTVVMFGAVYAYGQAFALYSTG